MQAWARAAPDASSASGSAACSCRCCSECSSSCRRKSMSNGFLPSSRCAPARSISAAASLDFYPTFFTSCCYPDGNFSWHHLWFLAYLFVLSVLLLPALLLLRRVMQQRRYARLSPVATSLVLVGLGLPLLVIEFGLRPSFPSTHALIDDWANNLHYMWLLLAGALAMAGGNLTGAARSHRRAWLVAGAILSAGWLALRFGLMPMVPPSGTGLALRTAAEIGVPSLPAQLWQRLSLAAAAVPHRLRRHRHALLHRPPDRDRAARLLAGRMGRCTTRQICDGSGPVVRGEPGSRRGRPTLRRATTGLRPQGAARRPGGCCSVDIRVDALIANAGRGVTVDALSARPGSTR